jgi:hypothetical protein
MSDAAINREGLGDAREAIAEQGRQRRQYTHPPDPDPAQAAREAAYLRARNRELHPLWAGSVEAIVDRSRDLDTGLVDVARLKARTRQRASRSARS